LLVRGTEIPVGVMTAVIGTPYFILLARRGKGAV
jgi:ABC-type Fe3+-siderophore transport system permease subunit